MTEADEMFDGQPRGASMIEDYVSYTGELTVAGNGNDRDLRSLDERCIHGNQALHGALLKEKRAFLNEFTAVTMAHHKVEISLLKEVILNAGHNEGSITFADFWYDDADGVAALCAKVPGKMIGPVVQIPRSFADQLLSVLGNGFGARRATKDKGDGSFGQTEVFGEKF